MKSAISLAYLSCNQFLKGCLSGALLRPFSTMILIWLIGAVWNFRANMAGIQDPTLSQMGGGVGSALFWPSDVVLPDFQNGIKLPPALDLSEVDWLATLYCYLILSYGVFGPVLIRANGGKNEYDSIRAEIKRCEALGDKDGLGLAKRRDGEYLAGISIAWMLSPISILFMAVYWYITRPDVKETV